MSTTMPPPPKYMLRPSGYWFQDSANPTLEEVLDATEMVFDRYMNDREFPIGLGVWQVSVFLYSEYLLRIFPKVFEFHTGNDEKLEKTPVAMEVMDTLFKYHLIGRGQPTKPPQEHCEEFHQFRDMGARLWRIVCALGPGTLLYPSAINTALACTGDENASTEMLRSVLGEMYPQVNTICRRLDDTVMEFICGREVQFPFTVSSVNDTSPLEGTYLNSEQRLSDRTVEWPEVDPERMMEEFFNTINTNIGGVYQPSRLYLLCPREPSLMIHWAAVMKGLHDTRDALKTLNFFSHLPFPQYEGF